MSESRQARAVRDKLELRWDEGREKAIAQKMVATRRRRRVVRSVASATAVLLLAAGAFLARRSSPDQQTLADGSTVEKLEAQTLVAVASETSGEVRVRLDRGRARFAVTKDPKRVFRVVSGDVSVVVLGTVFEVGRVGGRTLVKVSEGRVRVTRGDVTMLLGPGDEQQVDSENPPVAPPVAEPEVAQPTTEPAPPHREERTVTKSKAPPRAVPALSETMYEVDRLRLAKDAKGAASLLQKALRHHRDAPEAPQATFVLGRLQQEDLHDPAAAARTFATVRRLAPASSLAEDALAREVECLVASGDSTGARERAELYGRTYPRGAHRERLNKLVSR